MSKFIVKKRTADLSTTFNPYRPHGQWRYGKWQTVSKHTTEHEAAAHLETLPTGIGFMQWAIWHAGKRITQGNQS